MKFVQSYRIRFSESDRHACATPLALFHLLQETAIAHSSSVALDGQEIRKRNLAWMMNRCHMKFERYPRTDTEVSVTTWANTLTGLYAIREWRIEDADGVCVAATGRWIIFDTAKRRILKIPTDFADMYGEVSERALEDSFDRMQPIDGGEHQRTFHVRVSDLDTNQHANSGCYVDWALEAVPHEIASTRRPSAIEIMFKKESVLGEGLVSFATQTTSGALRFHHTVAGEGDRTARAIAFTQWPAEAAFEPPEHS